MNAILDRYKENILFVVDLPSRGVPELTTKSGPLNFLQKLNRQIRLRVKVSVHMSLKIE